MLIVIQKELESFWGAEEIVEEMKADGKSQEDIEDAIVELVNEDVSSLLDGAEWQVIIES